MIAPYIAPERIASFAGIVTDDDDLLAAFLDADRNALGRAFIGTEDALQVRTGLQHGLGDFRRLQVIALAILDIDDLDVRMLGLHLVQEAVPAIDAGTACLVVHDEPDLARITDRRGHLVGGKSRGGKVVGGAGGQRNVAVDAGLK